VTALTYDPRCLLLTVPEASARLAMQPATLLKWIVSGRITGFHKTGRAWTITEADLLTWLEATRKNDGTAA